jgi:hypothetical protein
LTGVSLGPQVYRSGVSFQRRISRGDHELHIVSLRLIMPYTSMPCGRPPLKKPNSSFRGCHLQGGCPAAVFYPLGFRFISHVFLSGLSLRFISQVYLSGLDVADSRDKNLDCFFLNYYDYHSMWHVFSRSVHVVHVL